MFLPLDLLPLAGQMASEVLSTDTAVVLPASVGLDVAQLAAHAAGLAVIIRGVVGILRSPIGFAVWAMIPKQLRPFVVLLLGALASIFDAVALGQPLGAAVFAGVVAAFGAMGSHSAQTAVMARKAPAVADWTPPPKRD